MSHTVPELPKSITHVYKKYMKTTLNIVKTQQGLSFTPNYVVNHMKSNLDDLSITEINYDYNLESQ